MQVAARDPYAPLRSPMFQRFTAARFLASLGAQMMDVAVGWDLYERTGSALALGLIGLVQMLPILLLSMPAGQFIDRHDRRAIVVTAQSAYAIGALSLTLLTLWHGPVALVYLALVIFGASRAYNFPAMTAMLPSVVPQEQFTTAVALNSSTFQLAAVIGPALAGVLIGVTGHALVVFASIVLTTLLVIVLMLLVRSRTTAQTTTTRNWAAIIEGWRFLGQNQIILSAITLDLFAVLLGGATTLLPIYARDILHVGPVGLGWMRAAPSAGSLLIALFQANRRPYARAGRALLLAVAGFGAATIVFGISRHFWLSVAMLFLLGAFDNVSVVIRQSLILLRTPDVMRGRIAAVNSLFVNATNELGGFESGAVAQLLGPVVSVVAGGIGTILVVLGVAGLWPQLRRLTQIAPGEPVASGNGPADMVQQERAAAQESSAS